MSLFTSLKPRVLPVMGPGKLRHQAASGDFVLAALDLSTFHGMSGGETGRHSGGGAVHEGQGGGCGGKKEIGIL